MLYIPGKLSPVYENFNFMERLCLAIGIIFDPQDAYYLNLFAVGPNHVFSFVSLYFLKKLSINCANDARADKHRVLLYSLSHLCRQRSLCMMFHFSFTDKVQI